MKSIRNNLTSVPLPWTGSNACDRQNNQFLKSNNGNKDDFSDILHSNPIYSLEKVIL